jgi:hypothetical protein
LFLDVAGRSTIFKGWAGPGNLEVRLFDHVCD